MLRIVTGRCYRMEDALCHGVARAMAETQRDQLIVVPKQLTLQTEQTLLARLNLSGSFRLQVLSPQRLCQRIFAAAGYPPGERVDDRGRVLLAREAVKDAGDRLTMYRNAYQRQGFAERAARQLELLRQGGLTPQSLQDCAQDAAGQTRMKLLDLSLMLEAYERRLEGRYQDGESELTAATQRVRKAAFVGESNFWFYGFDMTPPPLTLLMAELGAASPEASMLLPMDADKNARDAEVFAPLRRAYGRLMAMARQQGAEVQCVELPDDMARKPELMHLERDLFAQPCHVWTAAPRDVQMAALRNPREEARFAAALVRRLCQSRKMRYNDIALLCQDVDSYALCLKEAFEDAGIPLFLSVSRPASRHALAEFLLSALRLLSKGFRTEDMLAFLNTQYTALDQDEADRLSNYAVRWGIRGKAFLTPFRRGLPEEAQVMEPLRQRLVAPLEAFRENLRQAGSLKEQLQAVFQFLTDTNAYAVSLDRQNALARHGERQLANELSQVWNRMLGAMDQMAALMEERKVSLKELEQLLSEALDAAVIKPLPQAGDAVYVQGTDRLLDRPVRAALMLGMTDQSVQDEEGLLSDAQRRELAAATKTFLGLTADERSNMRRFYGKSHVGMVREYLCVTYPLSGSDNAAQRPSAIVGLMRGIFPELSLRGGVQGDDSLGQMLDSTPNAALKRLAVSLAENEAGQKLAATLSQLGDTREALGRLRSALDRPDAGKSVSPTMARQLYGEIKRISVTRLERFAACPFSYFAQYGLRPEKVEPYQLRPRDEGTFLHDAIRDFLSECGGDLQNTTPETADAAMDRVADRLLDAMAEGPLGDTAVSLAQRRRLKDTARNSAEALVWHMHGSAFHPAGIEVDFGPGDAGELRLEIPGGDCALEGRIDRVDAWEEGGYLRVVDYKRGGQRLNLWEVYCGLRLQLMVYLAAAMGKKRSGSAGAYYFTVDEGILTTQSTDTAAIQQERSKKFRLNGLLPDDVEVMRAMSPDYPQVFSGNFGKNGLPYQGAAVATQQDFLRLTNRALDMARNHVVDIRKGLCAASPVETEGRSPCAWCDWRASCLFDPNVSPEQVRRPQPMRSDEVLMRLAEGNKEGENA